MPVSSKAQSRFLNWKKGHAWVKRHHFDNPTKGLPQHAKEPSEGAERVANLFGRSLLAEWGRHKDGCSCGFCRNRGNIANLGKQKEKEPEKTDLEEPKEPEAGNDGLEEKKLSSRERKNLPSSAFVFPKSRKYPIQDKPHARNALARVAQHGSSSQQAAVRSAVHSKFPDIGEGAERVARLFGRTLEGQSAAPGRPPTAKTPATGEVSNSFDRMRRSMKQAHRGFRGLTDRISKFASKLPEPPLGETKAPGEVKLSRGSTIGRENRAYHNMTSKQAMSAEWKPRQYIRAAAEASGQMGRIQGFKNKGMGQTTSGKPLPKTRPGESRPGGEAAKQIMEALLG
jgi:hypothetical protein